MNSHEPNFPDAAFGPRAGAQITSIFEGQPSKSRPFRIKTRIIWVLGMYGSSRSVKFLPFGAFFG